MYVGFIKPPTLGQAATTQNTAQQYIESQQNAQNQPATGGNVENNYKTIATYVGGAAGALASVGLAYLVIPKNYKEWRIPAGLLLALIFGIPAGTSFGEGLGGYLSNKNNQQI